MAVASTWFSLQTSQAVFNPHCVWNSAVLFRLGAFGRWLGWENTISIERPSSTTGAFVGRENKGHKYMCVHVCPPHSLSLHMWSLVLLRLYQQEMALWPWTSGIMSQKNIVSAQYIWQAASPVDRKDLKWNRWTQSSDQTLCFISVITDMIYRGLAVSICLSGKIIYHPEEKQVNALIPGKWSLIWDDWQDNYKTSLDFLFNIGSQKMIF